MALADQLRLMVLTDAGLLKGRDPLEACRRAVAGGATIGAVRPPVPPGFWVGAPVGSLAEGARGRPWPADYWSVGPCYTTDNKPDAGPPLGPEGFSRLARLAPAGVPVIGIGGITVANAAAIRRGGAVGVAVIGAIWGASDPERAARALRSAAA